MAKVAKFRQSSQTVWKLQSEHFIIDSPVGSVVVLYIAEASYGDSDGHCCCVIHTLPK